jgi:uncharacterized protein (DUF433 family)
MVASDPEVMSGEPVISGTRVPAETVVAYLRAGSTDREIYQDYPTLPPGSIDAVRKWAEETYGPNWLDPVHAPSLGR